MTLVELVVVIAVAGILLTLAAPGFRDFILMQRLKSINAQLVTDLQFARSEAAARSMWARVSFRASAAMTCYTIFTSEADNTQCNCLNGVGAACSGSMREIRTVQYPASISVGVRVPADQASTFAFDHVTGGLVSIPSDVPGSPTQFRFVESSIDDARRLRTEVGPTGRINVCAPASTSVGAPPCL